MNNDPESENEMGGKNRLTQGASQTAEELRGTPGGAGEEGQAGAGMMGNAKEKLGQMSESARAAAEAARQRAEELYGDARERAQEMYSRARDTVTTWSEDGLQYVRENPGTSIATALLAGVVLGFSLRR
jgi:ElaB/YqjD/DUF883 family membrane-anchored ribosome-binding protein